VQSGWVRRWLEVTAFVAVWVTAGELLEMSAEVYLLFASWHAVSAVHSALFVSVLWGLWHHPIVPGATVSQLLVLQVAMGPFLSLFWRRSGNLLAPGFAHAPSDSVRNALGLIP
jgi:membrane protease YdiL (CAAX protease family)